MTIYSIPTISLYGIKDAKNNARCVSKVPNAMNDLQLYVILSHEKMLKDKVEVMR